MSKKVRPDPPETYCNNGLGPSNLTCCLQPHDEGDHGCWHPEGDVDAAWVGWSRMGETRPVRKFNKPKKKHTPYDISAVDKAKKMGFQGEFCSFCGSPNTKRNGSCLVCTNCGRTTGCS